MKINRTNLLKALDAVSPGLGKNNIIEQATNFIFQDGDVFTFNDTIAVRHETELDIEGAVRAQELHKLLNKTKGKEIDLEVTDSGLSIKGQRSKANIAMEPNITLPIQEIGKPKKWNDLPEDFTTAIKFCAPVAGRDMTQPMMTNLLIKGKVIISCDGQRLAYYEFDDSDFDVILLPAISAKIVTGYDIIEYSVTDSWIHFRTKQNAIFSCRLYQSNDEDLAKFQGLEKHLDMEDDPLSFPKDTKEILERAGIFSTTEFDQDELVSIVINNNWMKIKGEGAYGFLEEKSRIKYTGDQIAFSVKPSTLESILSHSHSIQIGDGKMKFESGSRIYLAILEA